MRRMGADTPQTDTELLERIIGGSLAARQQARARDATVEPAFAVEG